MQVKDISKQNLIVANIKLSQKIKSNLIKRGYAPAVRRNGYLLQVWYTKKKRWEKIIQASTIVTKKLKLTHIG